MAPLSIPRDPLLEELAALVRIDSTNPGLVANGAGEADVASMVAASMRDLGLEVDVWAPVPNRPNVVGVLRGSGEGRSLMLNAHMDTVGVEGMEAPFTPRIEDGCMFGRGTQDMKGSLAAHLAAVRALQANDVELAGDLVIAAVIDEEHRSLGTESVVERYDVDGAIVTEPTDLELALAHKGFVWIDVETKGRSAHGSRPDEGIDANMRMGRVLSRLEALQETLRRRDEHPLVGRPSLHAARIEGGTASSVYASACRLRIERRTIPGEDAADVVAEIQQIVEALERTDSTFRASCEQAFAREPFEVSSEAPIAKAVRAAGAEVLGTPPPDVGQTFWTDAAILASTGVDTVVFGPEGGGLHTTEEWVDLDSVVDLAQILAETARRYCA